MNIIGLFVIGGRLLQLRCQIFMRNYVSRLRSNRKHECERKSKANQSAARRTSVAEQVREVIARVHSQPLPAKSESPHYVTGLYPGKADFPPRYPRPNAHEEKQNAISPFHQTSEAVGPGYRANSFSIQLTRPRRPDCLASRRSASELPA